MPMVVIFPPMIHQTQNGRHPADTSLSDYEPELWIFRWYCRADKRCEATNLIADLDVNNSV